MKNGFFTGLVGLGITALLFTSCAKLPQPEIDAAKTAVEEARAAGAEIYVHDNYVILQDSLNSVMVSIEEQNSKFIKNYSGAKEELLSVTQFAQEVTQQTQNRKAELRVEIQNTISEVKALIETNRQLILEAPRGKEGTTALAAMKEELNTIEVTINEVSSMIDTGDYLATLDKAKVAKEKASSINTELSTTIAKYNANVKNKRG